MGRLRPDRLHVTFIQDADSQGPVVPRRYTLTHSDLTGDLFLTIGLEYNEKQFSGLYTRLMRDEVLAEWQEQDDTPALHVHCHVSGGALTLGPAAMRLKIFERELPLVLEALRFGDRGLFEAHPELDHKSIIVHFHARQLRYDRVESWGVPADYYRDD